MTPSKPSSEDKPSKPSESTTPSQPSSEAKPSKPSENTTPSQPSAEAEPSKSSESTTPSQPTSEAEPSKPSETVTPSQPSATTKPSEPGETVSTPTKPDHEEPSQTDVPSQPDTPTTPQDAQKAGLSIRLSASTYKYNAKAHKPTVVITTKTGERVSAKNYTVSYSGACKKVGTYTVTVTFTGNYSGTLKKTFTIKPYGTSIRKLTAANKGFIVKLKKQATQTTGYQLQYSTSKNFSSRKTKTITITNTTTTTKKITKLLTKRKYFVRVRTYKYVNGKNIASAWSTTKNVTTK